MVDYSIQHYSRHNLVHIFAAEKVAEQAVVHNIRYLQMLLQKPMMLQGWIQHQYSFLYTPGYLIATNKHRS